MLTVRSSLLVLSVLLLAACNAAAQPAQATQAPVPVQTPLAVVSTQVETATSAPTATETVTPSPSEIATPAEMIPAFLTATPGIAATLTAAYSTPGVKETMAAQQTMGAATAAVLMPGFSASLLSKCPNPSDPPKQNWMNIPVMPQATAGQVVETLLGSYYCFRAPVTVAEVETFFKSQLAPPNWTLQSDTNGQMVFIGSGQAGFQYVFLVSGPGNKNDMIVAINATKPVAIPIPTP
jgi:hypothetical protein